MIFSHIHVMLNLFPILAHYPFVVVLNPHRAVLGIPSDLQPSPVIRKMRCKMRLLPFPSPVQVIGFIIQKCFRAIDPLRMERTGHSLELADLAVKCRHFNVNVSED